MSPSCFYNHQTVIKYKMIVRYMLPQLKDEQDRLNGFN